MAILYCSDSTFNKKVNADSRKSNADLRKFIIYGNLRAICLFILVFAICGCGQSQQVKSKEEILKLDPDFLNAITKKEKLDGEINDLQKQFMQDKAVIDAKIAALNDELKIKKKNLISNIKDAKAKLDPERLAISARIKEIKLDLKTKRDNLIQVLKMSRSAQDIYKKSQIPTQEEKERWENMMPVLDDEIIRLRRQTGELQLKLDYLNSELTLLRQ